MQNNWVLLNTGAECQPLKSFGYHFFGQADNGLSIAGYLHWLQIWDEATGCVTIDVYYPVEPLLGENIKVLTYINNIEHEVIDWRHGDENLFLLYIQPHLV
jgi:hypothetical protein